MYLNAVCYGFYDNLGDVIFEKAQIYIFCLLEVLKKMMLPSFALLHSHPRQMLRREVCNNILSFKHTLRFTHVKISFNLDFAEILLSFSYLLKLLKNI